MKRYNSIRLSTDVDETEEIYFEEEMLDFSYKQEETADEADELQMELEEEPVLAE